MEKVICRGDALHLENIAINAREGTILRMSAARFVCCQINRIQIADLPVEPLQTVEDCKCEERDGFSTFL